ncbi:MAG: DUF2268 domain-containing putative Zn-dependent protease [Vagococcus sp.]|uniref:DUF2268 domain-containing protein n=1 Tax=Vagococcus sp. TaxID=1933889 RepID=UPI002FC74CA0
MKLIIENTIEQYKTSLLQEEKADFYCYHMMKPFETMWQTMGVPLKAKDKGGYDVLMATGMMGYLNINQTTQVSEGIEKLEEIDALKTAEKTLTECLAVMDKHKLKINVDELYFGMYLADPAVLSSQNNYCGFGGIPGFIHTTILPNDYNTPRLPSLIAHEFHHNIRMSYFDWKYGDITVGDYIVIEGLAESFAKEMYGEEWIGSWATLEEDDLEYSIEVFKDALDIKGFAEVSSYLYGDTFAKEKGYSPVGLSDCAGYAVGYKVVQEFMKKNKVSIFEATLLEEKEILNGCGLF